MVAALLLDSPFISNVNCIFTFTVFCFLRVFLTHSPIDDNFKQIYLTHKWYPSGANSWGNEGVLHTPQNFRTGASPSDAV